MIWVHEQHGKPDWGNPLFRIPAIVTEFETQVARLGLKTAQYVGSLELRGRCDSHFDRNEKFS